MGNFLLADFNLLCADKNATANRVRAFLRSKYGVSAPRLIKLLGTEGLSQALMSEALIAKRAELGLNLDFAAKPKQKGEKLPIFPHFRTPNGRGELKRTTFLTDSLRKPRTARKDIQPEPDLSDAVRQASESVRPMPSPDPTAQISSYRPVRSASATTCQGANVVPSNPARKADGQEQRRHTIDSQEDKKNSQSGNDQPKGKSEKENTEGHQQTEKIPETCKERENLSNKESMAMKQRRDRADRILANLSMVTKRWESMEGAMTYRGKVDFAPDQAGQASIRELLTATPPPRRAQKNRESAKDPAPEISAENQDMREKGAVTASTTQITGAESRRSEGTRAMEETLRPTTNPDDQNVTEQQEKR